MVYTHIKSSLLLITLSLLTMCNMSAREPGNYGKGLPETGSDKPAFTIYTNPAEDCSTGINISWGSPRGTVCKIELTNEDTGRTRIYKEGDKGFNPPKRCTTFDNIYSQLYDGKNVYEKHDFDKYGVEITGLDPDTEYRYRIVTINPETDEEEFSDDYYFHTAGAEEWKAAVIGDFHHWSPQWSRINNAMEMVDKIDSIAGGINWVLTTGDQSSWGGSYNFWTEISEQPESMDNMWAAVQGNHDHDTRDKKKSDDFFRDSHYFPQNGYEGQEGVSYWFKYGDVLFLMLNNEAMRAKGSFEPAVQWMEKVIKENPSKYVVVVQHSEWLIGTDGTTSQIGRFNKIFDRLGVDLAIAGNNHAYIRTKPLKGLEPTTPEEGTFYVVTPSSDNSRGRDLKPIKQNKNIIAQRWSEGPKTVGAMLMDVNPERIVMTLYDRYGKARDTFTVPAKR